MNEKDPHQHDPWNKNDKHPGPPELDKLLHEFFIKIKKFFDKKSPQNGQDKPPHFPIQGESFFVLIILALIGVVLACWTISGFYIVGPSERAVVMRLGKYVKLEMPGLHWVAQFVESKNTVDIQKHFTYQHDDDFLTKDEQIANISMIVTYYIKNPQDYLFNSVNPEAELQQSVVGVLEQLAKGFSLNEILTTQQDVVCHQVEQALQNAMDKYRLGLGIVSVNFKSINPPEEVMSSFNDVIKAQEDEQADISKANAYADKVQLDSTGKAALILQTAQAYQQEEEVKAQGETEQFLTILKAYQSEPQIIRSYLYFDTMTSILKHANKIFVDANGSNNLLYLPMNKWFDNGAMEKTMLDSKKEVSK